MYNSVWVVTFLVVLLPSYVMANEEEAEIVVADYKDWTHAVAFYVDAPRKIQKAMSLAVRNAQEIHETNCSFQKEPHWLCSSKKLRYFRGITGVGQKSKHGFVCIDEPWISRQSYYPVQMMMDDGCIRLDWNDGDKVYEVAWP